MVKIDVSGDVMRMEGVLRRGQDRARCITALAILRRWQFDEMLDDTSRERARVLVEQFERRSWTAASSDQSNTQRTP